MRYGENHEMLTTEDLDKLPCLLRNMVEENGKTIKQNNMERTHGIPLGALVETEEGLRLWVTYQGRDCDGTPLYWLSFEKELDQSSLYDRSKQTGGYSEETLTLIVRLGGRIEDRKNEDDK